MTRKCNAHVKARGRAFDILTSSCSFLMTSSEEAAAKLFRGGGAAGGAVFDVLVNQQSL
jgi:hypothetical protein